MVCFVYKSSTSHLFFNIKIVIHLIYHKIHPLKNMIQWSLVLLECPFGNAGG